LIPLKKTADKRQHWLKWAIGAAGSILALYLLLLIPEPDAPVAPAQSQQPFAWNRDAYWSLLESKFREARTTACAGLSEPIAQGLSQIDSLTALLRIGSYGPVMPLFGEIESRFFELGVLVAACPSHGGDFMRSFGKLRYALKRQSEQWNMNTQAGRDCIYRLLYGGRIAVEEIILQSAAENVSPAIVETNEPSATPSATILGVEIHSGDILVSRGGAPTSALIARSSDYAGNFSHVALVYVDEISGVVSIVESHIEKGVALASLADYLKDTKLRILILRLRSDLPTVQADPMLPHKAAQYLFERARSGHIPYDFAMDTRDESKMFCSEVAAHAYQHVGIALWSGLSHISGAGARNWLAAFGARNFTTQEPSDLEYDPKLRVIAEWRDYETLSKDHLDNAVIDVMLESADSGAELRYNRYMLPVARILKAYSSIMNEFGRIGPIPEGMTATAALKNKWFSGRHQAAVEQLRILAEQFQRCNGYFPPYWDLIKLGRNAYASVAARR
jgi:hypothetical protein